MLCGDPALVADAVICCETIRPCQSSRPSQSSPEFQLATGSTGIVFHSSDPRCTQMESSKCFVGGLSQGTTIASLVEHFNQFGIVKEVIIPRSPEDNTQRGFAFVTFSDEREALDAMEAPSSAHVVSGKHVDVKACRNRSLNGANGNRQKNPMNPADNRPMPPGELDPKKIFIGGLPMDATEEGIREVFAEYGPVLHVVVMMDNTTGRPKGFGFVTFDSTEICDRLVKEHYVTYLDKKIEVKRAIMSRSYGRFGGHNRDSRCGQQLGARTGYDGRNYSGRGDDFSNRNGDPFSYRGPGDIQRQLSDGPMQGQQPWNPQYNQPYYNVSEFQPEIYNAVRGPILPGLVEGYGGYTFDLNTGMQIAYPSFGYQALEGFKPIAVESADIPVPLRIMDNNRMPGFMPLAPNQGQPVMPVGQFQNGYNGPRGNGSGSSAGSFNSNRGNAGPRGAYSSFYNNSNNHQGGHGYAKAHGNQHPMAVNGQSMTGSGDSVSGGSYKDVEANPGNPYRPG